MIQSPFRIVFMGCPDFAVPSLQALVKDDACDVVAVYCMPDKPKGRGRKSAPTPVKSCALKHGIEVNTPASFRKYPEEIDKLCSYKPDFIIVVAYGLILPQSVLDIPSIAAVNVHASILPAYRGPAPIHHAIMNGDKVTGNSIMLMNNKMDEGDILAISKVSIEPADNLATLHDKLSLDGSKLLIPTIKEFAAQKLQPVSQNHEQATYTGKISSQTAKIDWNKTADEVHNLIRAMCPFPGAWFMDENERIKVFASCPGPELQLPPGDLAVDKKQIQVACYDNTSIYLLELQRPGKARVKAEDFLRGYKFRQNNLAAG